MSLRRRRAEESLCNTVKNRHKKVSLLSKASAFAGVAGEPTGLGSGRESGGSDAAGLAERMKVVPVLGGNDIVAVGSEEAGLEIEGCNDDIRCIK
jgi:hypothetical protein